MVQRMDMEMETPGTWAENSENAEARQLLTLGEEARLLAGRAGG